MLAPYQRVLKKTVKCEGNVEVGTFETVLKSQKKWSKKLEISGRIDHSIVKID